MQVLVMSTSIPARFMCLLSCYELLVMMDLLTILAAPVLSLRVVSVVFHRIALLACHLSHFRAAVLCCCNCQLDAARIHGTPFDHQKQQGLSKQLHF